MRKQHILMQNLFDGLLIDGFFTGQQGVAHERYYGHGPYSTGNRGNERRLFFCIFKIDITAEFSFHAVDTHIYYHRTFFEEGKRYLERGGAFWCFMLDLDDFKRVNDTLGHLAGDEVLKTIAATLRSAVRNQDLVGRVGGDEFAILCANSFGLLALYRNDPDPFVSKSRVENINSLVTAMGSFQPSWSGLADFLESITLDSSTLPGDGESNRISADKSVVKLITMHNTKGLEFDRVFVTGLEDDIIPGNRETMNESDEEEERRILYVAVTRARSELYLTWVKRRKLWGRVMYQYPTRFFKDFEGCYEGTLAEGTSFSEPQTSYTNRYSYQPRSASPGAAGVSLFHEPPAKKTERAENRTVFCVDDAVLSPDYGRGVIVSAENRGDKTIIRVAFENGRKAIYNTKFCNLEKLDQGLDKPGGKTIE